MTVKSSFLDQIFNILDKDPEFVMFMRHETPLYSLRCNSVTNGAMVRHELEHLPTGTFVLLRADRSGRSRVKYMLNERLPKNLSQIDILYKDKTIQTFGE